MARGARTNNLDSITTKPAALFLIYEDGYTELANYNKDLKRFNQFKPTTTEEIDEFKDIIGLTKSDYQIMPNCVSSYKDINNFSFIIKKGWKTLKFLNFDDPNNVIHKNIKINKTGHSEIPTLVPELYVKVDNNILFFYVIKGNKIYSNPLPNNFPNGSFCIGSADKEWQNEPKLKDKINQITEMYFISIFSHAVNHDLLDDWFLGEINYKKLELIKTFDDDLR